MKSIVLKFSLILIAVVLNNIINRYISNYQNQVSYRNSYTFDWIGKLPNKPKIIIAGSSTSKTGVSATLLQEQMHLQSGSVINISTKPNNPDITYSILRNQIDKFDKNAVILYGLDPWITSRYYYQGFNILLSNWDFKERLYYLRNAEHDEKMLLTIINGGNIFSTIFSIVSRQKSRQIPADFGSESWSGKDPGAVNIYRDWSIYEDYQISQRFLSDIRKIDTLAHAKGMRLILYVPMYSDRFTEFFLKQKMYHKLVPQIKKQIRYGVFYPNIVSVPEKYFCDPIHANTLGKEINGARVVKLLEKYYGQ